MTIPSFAKAVSNCLSHVLENVGVNEETVAKRRELYHQSEVINEIGHNLMAKYCNIPSFKNYKICHFGSRIEGSTTLGMNSDLDLVYLCPFLYSIVKSNLEETTSRFNLMIEKSAPNGYCKLKGPVELEYYVFDHKGNSYIPNAHIEKHLIFNIDMSGSSPMIKNGPSLSDRNTDHIKAILVPSHLSMTNNITKRFRSYQWPTKQLIDTVTEKNGLVVPIGHPQSENANIEWRLSYSFAERLFIFDFNITQLRCFVILKLIKKTFFQPIVGDNFTSYHCKNLMFYTIARTSPCLWKKDSLFQCILNCLSSLLHFLSSHYCPHFFDPSVNLFTGKISHLFCKRLSKLVKDLLNGNLLCLLQIRVDDIGIRILNQRTIISPNIFRSQEYIERRIIAEIIFDRNQCLIKNSRYSYVCMFKAGQTLKNQIFIGFMLIKKLLNIIGNEADKEHVARLMLPHYLSKHCSLLAAYRIKKNQPIGEDIVDMFKIGFQTDATSSRIKLASIFCCNSEYDRALQVLNETRNKYFSETYTFPACFRYTSSNTPLWEKCYKMSEDTIGDIYCSEAYSFCVEFKRKDIWCCPLGMRRSVAYFRTGILPDVNDNNSFHRNFGIELDSNVVFHYLCYLTHSGLADNESRVKALKELTKCVIDNPKTWGTHFFKIANEEDSEIVKSYRQLVQKTSEFDKNDPNIRRILNNFRIEPFGSIRQCLWYTFERTSSFVQHTGLALILIGYSFELENKIDFASAFYWFSFLIDSELNADQHLLRVCPLRAINEYFTDFHNDIDDMATSIALEIKLIPEIVEAFVNLMQANVYLGLLEETDFQEGTYRARSYVCLLNALVKNKDRHESEPLEVFPTNRRIVQAKESSIYV